MTIKDAIDKTIKYSRKYGSSLTRDELFERLIDSRIYKKTQISNVKCPMINGKKVYIKEKVEKAEKLAKEISNKFKDVLFLGLTGSVAAGYPKKNDDIDFLIITQKNRLWLTRLKLKKYLLKNKIPHRRSGVRERKDELCFNLWLDLESLKMKKNKHNLRNAMDLIMMKVLVNKNGTYEKFILSNGWVKKYVATGYNEKISNFQFPISKKNNKNKSSGLINWLMFVPQYLFMKSKIRNEEIGLHKAFFHPTGEIK